MDVLMYLLIKYFLFMVVLRVAWYVIRVKKETMNKIQIPDSLSGVKAMNLFFSVSL